MSTIKVTTVSSWPMYQKFLTHLTDFLNAHESKCSVLGQNGSFIRNVHYLAVHLCGVHCIHTLCKCKVRSMENIAWGKHVHIFGIQISQQSFVHKLLVAVTCLSGNGLFFKKETMHYWYKITTKDIIISKGKHTNLCVSRNNSSIQFF